MQIEEVKRYADDHENQVFDVATSLIWESSFHSKGYGVRNHTLYVLDLVYLTSELWMQNSV